jgi:hypothetical protein
MEVSGEGCLSSEERVLIIHWMGLLKAPRTGLDMVAKRKSPVRGWLLYWLSYSSLQDVIQDRWSLEWESNQQSTEYVSKSFDKS